MDFQVTDQKTTVSGKDFAVDDSEYADNTAVLFPTRESLEECLSDLISHFKRFGAEIHVGHADTEV